MLSRRVGERIVVADLCKVIIAWIGVAALAVVEIVADGMVVVALNAPNLMGRQEGKHAIGMRAKGAKIPQAIQCVHAAAARIIQGGLQRQVVVVDAAKTSDAIGHQISDFRFQIGDVKSKI